MQVEIDETTAQGAYANLSLVAHNATEFVLDFIFVQPQQPKAKVRSRIISSPVHIKRFLQALQENVQHYEKKFGEIKESGAPTPSSSIHIH
jgi:hypothetical protein